MSLRTECNTAIYSYVDQETQTNAALTGEHKDYVLLVLQLLRDEYKRQLANGETTFTVPTDIDTLLTQERPW